MSDLRFKALGISDKKGETMGFFGSSLLVATAHFIVGWRVGVWLSSPALLWGLRKLRPRVELQSPWDKARALATEQKRNVQLDLAMRHAKVSSVRVGSGETAVLQVERANRRR